MNQTTEQDTVVLQFYAAIAQASGQMLQAAQASDWDSLCEAEEICSKLIAKLQKLQEEQRMTEDERQLRVSYLKKILEDDAAIRHITEPRLRQLEDFLNTANNSQRLQSSYGNQR
jgi:flagellar protein FliT